ATGSIANTASVAAPAGTTDPTAGNNSATDTDTITSSADLSVTKSDGKTSVDAGVSNSYSVVVTNGGPSNVSGATVTDTFPAAFTGASWQRLASRGSSCPASRSRHSST